MRETFAFRGVTAPTDPPQGRNHQPGAGLTVEDIARRYRVSPDKVRAWISRGELRATNTAAVLSGKPRWVIPPEALADFEAKRAGGPPPKAHRRRRQPAAIDFYPD